MKRRTIFSLAIMFGLFLALFFSSGQVYGQPLLAPIDTSFTYQGKLINGGTPANGAYDFTFALYDAPNGGAQVGGAVTRNGVTVTDGLFTVQLDFGTVFDGTALYLEIGVRPASGGAYTTLAPRQALTATPYARYAAQSPWSGLVGVPPGFADGTDDGSIYTAGMGLFLNATEFSILGSFQLPQGCNSGQLPQWNGSAWICTDDSNSGGDITGVMVGTGLTGGGGSGNVTLGLVPSYQLPQTCANGQIAQWNGGAWVCANDSGATYTAGSGIGISGNVISAAYAGSGGDYGTAGTLARSDHTHSSGAGGPAGGDLTGTYPNPDIAANAVGSAEIANNSVDMADTQNWMGFDAVRQIGFNSDGGDVYLYGTSFTPSAAGRCLVTVNAFITSAGNANSNGAPEVDTFMSINASSITIDPTSYNMPLAPPDVSGNQPISASVNYVWNVTSVPTQFGCRVSDPDGSGGDWGSDETIYCRISYICQ